MGFSSVLAATDFSKDSLQAARLALAIARRHSARLTLLHVDQLPAIGERMAERVAADVLQAYLEERNAVLRARLEAFRAEVGPGSIELALARDAPAAAIVQRAAEHPVDLVVVAPHGRSSSRHYLLGSVSFDVAGGAPCPVLVARHDSEFVLPESGTFERVLVTVPNEGPSQAALALAAALGARNGSVDLAHVIEPREPLEGPPLPAAVLESVMHNRSAAHAALKRAAEALRAQGFSTSIYMEKGDAADMLLEPLVAKQNDLVIAGTRSPRRAGTLGAVTRRLLRHSPVPVAVVPA